MKSFTLRLSHLPHSFLIVLFFLISGMHHTAFAQNCAGGNKILSSAAAPGEINTCASTPYGNPALLNPPDGIKTNIFGPMPYNPLLPDGDQFYSLIRTGTIGGFACGLTNLGWQPIRGIANGNEPSNDLATGSGCGATDIVNDGSGPGGAANGDEFAYYTIVDLDCDPSTLTDAYVIFRVRIAKEATGAFGFSMLIDTDNNCATADLSPAACAHCFEREVWLSSGGGSQNVNVDDVSANANVGDNATLATYPLTSTQVARSSKKADCTSDAIFYTFSVSFADMGLAFGNGFSIGIVPATASAGSPVIDGNHNFSDVGGLAGATPTADCADCIALEASGANTECVNNCLLACASAGNAVTFPVEYLSFHGTMSVQGIALNWSTAGELNNDYFVVERMLADRPHVYEELGSVSGAGTTQQVSSYDFLDRAPHAEVNRYRLRQVDYDGQFTYSSIIEVHSNLSQTTIQVAPNVVEDQINLSIMSPEAKQMRIEVLSIDGKVVYDAMQEVFVGTNQFQIPSTDFPAGMYAIRVSGLPQDGVHYAKCMKL